MIPVNEIIDIDLKYHSDCCGAEVDINAALCTNCKEECDWSIDLDGCDSY